MSREAILEDLRKKVEGCRKCALWRTRNRIVFGEGPADAEVMIVGLGPGRQEDLQGRPFVGAAGKFLDQLLSEAGLSRDRIYITNVIKCFLPGNRATEEHVRACTPYLDQQIEVIRPKLIIALGNIAACYLLGKFGLRCEPMEKIHGRAYDVSSLMLSLRIVPMYHPASALRNPGLRDKLIEDWRELGRMFRDLAPAS
ncbi:MAG: uracil-DNA glycosylase [Nitrososphaerota archaeon]